MMGFTQSQQTKRVQEKVAVDNYKVLQAANTGRRAAVKNISHRISSSPCATVNGFYLNKLESNRPNHKKPLRDDRV